MLPSFTRGALFANRREAGQALAKRLVAYANRENVVVLALPSGGVPVAYEIAAALRAPLDVVLVRTLGVPQQRELAIGTIASGDICTLNTKVIQLYGVPGFAIDAEVEAERRALKYRERVYRAGRPPLELAGKYAIVVADGLATGASMRTAVAAVRRGGAVHVVVAVPVSARQVCCSSHLGADDVVCLHVPEPFVAVGLWYEDFSQTTDDEVNRLLDEAAIVDEPRLLAAGV
jgi:putative phosphoribosyl transferase